MLPRPLPLPLLLLFSVGAGRAQFVARDGESGCEVLEVDGESCMQTARYGTRLYENDVTCSVDVASTGGTLRVDGWELESCCDKLTHFISGGSTERYDETPPAGVSVSSGDTLRFTSDNSVQKDGFRVCLVASAQQEQEQTTTDSVAGSVALWGSVTGPCTASDGCFRSPNYPYGYSVDQSCSATIMVQGSAGTLSSEGVFDVGDRDTVRVHPGDTDSNPLYSYIGGHTSGTQGPSAVPVENGYTVTFSADDFDGGAGFQLCLNGARGSSYDEPANDEPANQALLIDPTLGGTMLGIVIALGVFALSTWLTLYLCTSTRACGK